MVDNDCPCSDILVDRLVDTGASCSETIDSGFQRFLMFKNGEHYTLTWVNKVITPLRHIQVSHAAFRTLRGLRGGLASWTLAHGWRVPVVIFGS